MFNNLNSTLKKVVVIFLIITLTYANLVLIGTNIMQGLFSYALEETEEQNIVVANQELVMNKVYGEGEEQKRIVQVAVETGIYSEEYPIKTSTITLGTDLIEEALVDVKVTELNKNSYTTGTWILSEEGKLVISLVNENETLETKENGLDKLLVTYVFENSEVETINKPLEKVEVTTYGGENLINEGTDEDTVANFEEINVEKELSLLNIINKDIHKTTIESGKIDFTESLKLDLSYRNLATNITIEDVSNDFYNVDGQENEEIVLQYKTTTINKEDLINLLGEEGKLVITDIITNNVVAEITSEVLATDGLTEQKFTDEETSVEEVRSSVTVGNETVEVEYIAEVTNIKFEILNINIQSESEIDISDFVIENTKSILNVNDVENLSYLQENVKYVMDGEKTTQGTINFKNTVTRASLTVDNTEWVVGETNTVNYTITLDTTTEKSELFVNPMFLIELPSSVESINTANSEFTVNNDGGVFNGKKVFTTTVLGKKYVVVTLIGEQTEESVQNGNTTINLKLELNVSADETEGNETTKIYYQNDTVTTYDNGTSFDTDEVEISLILGSEDKEEIYEEIPGEKEEDEEYIANIFISMSSSRDEIIKEGETIEYILSIYNYEEEQQNLKIIDILPDGVILEKVLNEENEDVIYTYSEETKTLEINIDKIEGAKEESFENEETGEIETYTKTGYKVFRIFVKTNELEEGIYSKELKNIAKIQKEEIVLKETETVNILSKGVLNVQTDELPEQINENEEMVLVLKIENKGMVSLEGINIKVELPKEISPRIYEQYLVSTTGEKENRIESTLNNNLEIDIQEIPAETIHYLKLIGTVKELEENKSINIIGMVDEQEVTWTTELIDLNGEEEPDEPTTPDNPDEPTEPENPDNPDAPINPDEPSNPDNPKNPTNPDKLETITEGFDLSLIQYLNKVTVENAEGITTYEYTDTNFAKVEIHSKHMNGSKVTLEYKMIVKNQGTIPGYARKIVNYKPEGLEFNQDLNKDWYVGDDGNIYSVALINKLLNPGESAELTIILTKQMTNEDGGTIKNTMEIYEASNDENVEDLNSIPGDKLDGQNDMSTAQVIVAVKTGTIILYIALATAVIVIIGLGFYKIKKVTLNKKGGC